MARPSKLSPEQWQQVERRAAEGESVASLSKEFGISRSAISDRVSGISDRVRETAHKMAEAQAALAALPVAQQYNALNLAEKLRNISASMATTAELGAANSAKLNRLASRQLAQIGDELAEGDIERVKTAVVLTEAANRAAVTPMGLLASNKDTLREPPPTQQMDSTTRAARVSQLLNEAKRRQEGG